MSMAESGRCLVLGGRGFIGSHLVDHLLDSGVPVRMFTRRPPADDPHLHERLKHPLLQVFTGDFNNEVDLEGALQGCETCVHLISATIPKTSNENMGFDVESNLLGSIRLLQISERRKIRKVVFVSSGGTVYGEPLYTPIDEDHPTFPMSSYGVTKLAAEKYFYLFKKRGVDGVVVRLSNPFGERQRAVSAQGAIAVFMRQVLRREAIHIWGDGSVTRDYIYVKDCVRGIASALNYSGEELIFNIGSGVGRSLNEIVSHIGQATGLTPDVIYEPARSFDVKTNVLSIDKAERLLNWRPVSSFDDALAKTVQWQTTNPSAA